MSSAELSTQHEKAIQFLGAPVVQEERFWVRAVATRHDTQEPWKLRALEAVSPVPPPGWDRSEWNYPTAVLVSDIVDLDVLAGWVSRQRVTLGAVDVPFPVGQGPIRWTRRDSRQPSYFGALDWPSQDCVLANLENVEPPVPLVSRDAPSFTNLYTVATHFFGIPEGQFAGGSLSANAVIRCQDLRARINTVGLSNDAATVEIEGMQLDGLYVERAGDVPGETRRLYTSRRYRGPEPDRWTETFPLADGVPAGAWILIKDDESWIDRRHLTWPWARGTEPGVEVKVEAETLLEFYVANRENDRVEFKRRIPESSEGKAGMMKTVAAFANGTGGALLIGISDEYEIVGVPAAAAAGVRDTFGQLVDSWLDRHPSYHISELPCPHDHNFVVLEVTVDAGVGLYSCSRPNEEPRFFVRHQARTVPARASEIEAICRRGRPAGS